MLARISDAVYNFQKYDDAFMAKTFDKLWVALGITPNVLTALRFIGTTILWVLFLNVPDPNTFWNTSILLLFIVTALTDLWDGALARNTNQITELGTLLDPLADKLLIGSVLFFLASTLHHWTLYMIIFLEGIMIVLNVIFYTLWKGKIRGANAFGKLKMALEVIFVILLLVGVYQQSLTVLNIGYIVGSIAILLAIISILKGIKDSGAL
ncbi:MAG: CDP-alcohol phosphatidyltransferase family protein [Candidatus Abawacabacteria bacterium]|nr:CDP-alcohol phosphatidyltransferase family protein [Candidatus Abawacabacteria bacterium]